MLADKPGTKYPLRTTLIFECDGGCGASAEANHPDGYIASHRLLIRTGWRDTVRNGRRVILCIRCKD